MRERLIRSLGCWVLVFATGQHLASGQEILIHKGMCDASAAVALDASTFAVANDEDNIIRIYLSRQNGGPVSRLDVGGFLQVNPRESESDIEGATRLGDRVFWITSHGRNKNGKYRSSRHRLFATRVEIDKGTVRLVPDGSPYSGLLQDLVRDSRLARFGLLRASQFAPKDPGGFNVEGLCAYGEGGLLIGFRNPIPDRQALLIPLLNPDEVIKGRSARFGHAILLDLGGRGVRDMVPWKDGYLIVGGAADSGKKTRLYFWKGGSDQPRHITELRLGDLNPEAVVVYPKDERNIHLLSDDGTLEFDGIACKSLPVGDMRQFRSLWFEMPDGYTGNKHESSATKP